VLKNPDPRYYQGIDIGISMLLSTIFARQKDIFLSFGDQEQHLQDVLISR
jgi:hypothetical protein